MRAPAPLRRAPRQALRLAGIVLIGGGALLSFAGEAVACTPLPYRVAVPDDAVYFLGTTTADTVLAGPGGVRYEPDPERDREIHGQVVALERVGGPAMDRLPAGSDRVVVVSWSSDSLCRPQIQFGSHRPFDPGREMVFMAAPRDPEHWVDGMPTFDLLSPADAYPYREREGADPRPLSGAEMFALYEVLPRTGDLDLSPYEAVRPLQAWIRENPELFATPPSEAVARLVLSLAESRRRAEIDSPLFGTWRLTVAWPGDGAANRVHPHSLAYGRTPSVAHPDGPYRQRPPPPAIPRGDGYYIPLSGSLIETDLPRAVGDERGRGMGGHLGVLEEPDTLPDGTTVWRGVLELGILERLFPGEARAVWLAAEDVERFRTRSEAGLPRELTARFTRHTDGRLTMEQETELGDGWLVVIRGEKVSDETIQNPYAER
jgi:hypothetical protein